MNKKLKTKVVELLKMTRDTLDQNQHFQFICIVVGHISDYQNTKTYGNLYVPGYQEAGSYVIDKIIRRRIGNQTLDDWVQDNIFNGQDFYGELWYMAEIHDYRIRWLDALIKEFS